MKKGQGDTMFYQVNSFERVGGGFILPLGTPNLITTTFMITTDIKKAVAKANECLKNGLDMQVTTWKTETEKEHTESIYAEEVKDTIFTDGGDGTVASLCVDRDDEE